MKIPYITLELSDNAQYVGMCNWTPDLKGSARAANLSELSMRLR